jgi:hypothetical protein
MRFVVDRVKLLAGLLVLSGLCLAMALSWVGTERVNLAYEVKRLENAVDLREDLVAKLEVERGNLVSPYRLRRLAEDMGLSPARPGQIRRASRGEAGP